LALLPFLAFSLSPPLFCNWQLYIFISLSFLRWPGGYSRKLKPSAPRFSIRSLIPLLQPSLHQRARVSREKRGIDLLFPVNSRTAGRTPNTFTVLCRNTCEAQSFGLTGFTSQTSPLSFISKWQNLNLRLKLWLMGSNRFSRQAYDLTAPSLHSKTIQPVLRVIHSRIYFLLIGVINILHGI